MKAYHVVVEKLMFEGNKVWQERTYKIYADNEDKARAIVHNSLVLHDEPRFRIADVTETTE